MTTEPAPANGQQLADIGIGLSWNRAGRRPAALLLVAAFAVGCGSTSHHRAVTPVCSRVTTNAHGDYVAPGHRPCVLTTPPPKHTVVRTSTPKVPATTPVGPSKNATRSTVTHQPKTTKAPAPAHAAVNLTKPRSAPAAPKKVTKSNASRPHR